MNYTEQQVVHVLNKAIEFFVRDADREGVGMDYRNPGGRYNADALLPAMLFLERVRHHRLSDDEKAIADYFLILKDDEKERLMREALSKY